MTTRRTCVRGRGLWPRLLALAGVLAWAAATAAADPLADATYSFAIVPQQSATELARTWGPLLRTLEARTGLRLGFATAPDIPTFERRLAAGEYDFAYMNPYHYTVFHQRPGYQVLAKEKDRLLKGILVVRADSPVQRLADLAGQTLVFPGPASFAATVLVRAALSHEGSASRRSSLPPTTRSI